MSGIIREFRDRDYAGVVEVKNAVDPEHPQSVETERFRDENRSERVDFRRWVWEEDGRILGFSVLTRMDWMYHPRKYYFTIQVHPDARRRGIGGALHAGILAAAREKDLISLRTTTSEAWPGGIRFLENRKYRVGPTEKESALDLRRFEPERFAADLARIEGADDVKLMSYDELAPDPDRHRKLYEFDALVGADMPSPEPYTVPDFEHYCRDLFEHPLFYPEGFYVAVDEDGGYVGLSNLWRRIKPDSLATGFTGVVREFRGRGLATALKVKVLSWAKATGAGEVITSNDSTNAGMLGINQRLGFEPRPAWIDYTLELAEETAAEEAS